MLGTLKVTYVDDSTLEGATLPVDAIHFERHFDLPVSAAFGANGMRLEHLWFFAWRMVRREQGHDPGDFDQWIDGVQTVEVVTPKASRPTRKAAGPSV
jgi:hypothetical protein